MFVWPAIFCLAAASVAFGFPGAIPDVSRQTSDDPQSVPRVNASKTIDVSGIKTRIKLILEQTLDIGDKKAVSNSTSLNVRVEKRDANRDAQNSKCDCSDGQCPATCPTRLTKFTFPIASLVTGPNTKEPSVVRIEREADQKVKATTKGAPTEDDDDDEDNPKTKTQLQESDSEDILGGYEGTPTRKSGQKEKAKQSGSVEDDYDDEEGESKKTTYTQQRDIPTAMLHRERQLYVRSLSELDKEAGHKDAVKRETPEISDWTQALINEALKSWAEVKPAYKDWDYLYPKMNQVRLAREAAKIGKPDASTAENDTSPATGTKESAGSNTQSKAERAANLKENSPSGKKKSADHVRSSKIIKRSVDPSGSEPSSELVSNISSAGVEQDRGKALTKEEAEELSETEKVIDVSKTVKYEDAPSTDDERASSTLNEDILNIHKIEDGSVKVVKRVRELPSGDLSTTSNKPEDVTPNDATNAPIKEKQETPVKKKNKKASKFSRKGHNKPENAPTVAEPKGDEAKNRLKSGLESSWGSGTLDSDHWQQERRLGDTRSLSEFNNLDIRYLGGNDLNIPPVDITDFHPEDVTGHEAEKQSQPANQGSPSRAKPVDLKQARSSGNENIALPAILMTPLALVTALKV